MKLHRWQDIRAKKFSPDQLRELDQDVKNTLREAVEAVAEMQRRSIELGTDAVSMEEIDAEIQAARRARFPPPAAGS